MSTAHTLGFCALWLGFAALMVGIVLSVMDKKSEFSTLSKRGPIILLEIGALFDILLFLLDWKWTPAYVAILLGISAIIAGTAVLMLA